MGEAAMVSEPEDWIFEISYDVDVRCFGRQCHGGGGQSRLAIETGASQASTSEKVS